VKEGPFADFSGQIDEINEDQLKTEGAGQKHLGGNPGRARISQVAKL